MLKHQTSHCWNPLCGRWAYKATASLRAEHHRRIAREEDERDSSSSGIKCTSRKRSFSILSLLPLPTHGSIFQNHALSPLGKIRQALQNQCYAAEGGMKVSRMKMCSSCRRGKIFCIRTRTIILLLIFLFIAFKLSIAVNFVRFTIGDQGDTRQNVPFFKHESNDGVFESCI